MMGWIGYIGQLVFFGAVLVLFGTVAVGLICGGVWLGWLLLAMVCGAGLWTLSDVIDGAIGP